MIKLRSNRDEEVIAQQRCTFRPAVESRSVGEIDRETR